MNYCKNCKYHSSGLTADFYKVHWCNHPLLVESKYSFIDGKRHIHAMLCLEIRGDYPYKPCYHYAPNRRMRIVTKIKNLFNRSKQ